VGKWIEIVTRSQRALHLDSIRKQILVLAVAATLLPALALIVVLSRQSRGSLGDQIAPKLSGASAQAVLELDRWLDERLYDLRAAATSYAVSDNLARIQGSAGSQALARLRDYLNSVRERSADCEALVLLDARGRVVAGSGGRMSGVQFSLERVNGLRTGDALVGDAYWDAGLGKAAITLAVPVRQADGRFAGALTAKINLRAVSEILERLAPGADSGAGAYVMTDQGRLILRSRVSSAELMRTKLPATVTQSLFDKEGAMVASKGVDGRDVFATLRRVPALHWAAVVDVPQTQAVRQAGALGSGAILGLVVLLAAAAGVAGLVGLLVVRPVERLAHAAAKVAAGDLSVEIPGDGGGGLGQLTQVFKNLVTRVREREGQGELERLSVTDALTGLYNRRHLMGTLANEVQRSRRLRRTFSVALADVDHFKQYNDTHGHLAGDAVLVKIAEILRKTTRGVDSVARYGGEEFVVMLIEAPIATAVTVAERIRARVAAEAFEGGRVTVSVGTAEYPAHGDTPEELIASSDAAMYEAKRGGRDRVVAAGGRAETGKEVKRRRKGEG
jgi:diguanylate cyclase (GGDEF)-like protein